MALPFYNWSKTAASNATADSTVNWSEGQAPSSVNNSARAMMASIAAWRDDTSGALGTGGTSSAYTVSTNQVFDTLAHMDDHMITIFPAVTNAASPTLNVDGLGAKAITSPSGTPIPAGTMLPFTPYSLTYLDSQNEWVLHNFFGNPYNIPLGASIDYWGTTVPNSSFAFPIGQAISRSTYATLFSLMGTTHGVGDGSTTFNIPDLTGRVTAMKEASATRLTSSYFVGDSTALGATGGSESHTLTEAQLAAHDHGVTDPTHDHSYNTATNASANGQFGSGSAFTFWTGSTSANTSADATGVTVQNAGGGNAHNNVQPTIICNKILRIL